MHTEVLHCTTRCMLTHIVTSSGRLQRMLLLWLLPRSGKRNWRESEFSAGQNQPPVGQQQSTINTAASTGVSEIRNWDKGRGRGDQGRDDQRILIENALFDSPRSPYHTRQLDTTYDSSPNHKFTHQVEADKLSTNSVLTQY